jgi:hypothetical protein
MALAKLKLNVKPAQSDSMDRPLAWLAIRLRIEFDTSRSAGRALQSRLVESYMRVAFAVPWHREFMHTGTPSEPVLAEAAARLMNSKLSENQFSLLSRAIGRHLLARGERGELTARLFMILAYDAACRQKPDSHHQSNLKHEYHGLTYHRPISVIDFVKTLFAPKWHETILSSRPVGDKAGLPFREAFSSAYLCFSHFSLADDYDIIKRDEIYKLLLRGVALQCRNYQKEIDYLFPVLFEDPTQQLATGDRHVTKIAQENASILQIQVKNRKSTESLTISPTITQPENSTNALPVLSFLLELGDASKSGISLSHEPGRVLRNREINPHEKHYQITAHGTSRETYAIIQTDQDKVAVDELLAGTSVVEDFARSDFEESKNALQRLGPSLGKGNPSMDWFITSPASPSVTNKTKRKRNDPPS